MERFKEETILEFLVQKEFIKLDEENHKHNIYGKQLEEKLTNIFMIVITPQIGFPLIQEENVFGKRNF